MSISTAKQAAFTNTVLRAFAVLGVLGIVGLVLTAMLGFEEPNTTLLVLSSVLLFAAPLATHVHLSVTRDLTREEKRIWIQQLDADHSVGERRFLIIGMSVPGRILVVSHTETGDTIRIISARAATRRERTFYEEGESSWT